MAEVHVLEHPLIQHKLSILRDENTSVKEFRELVSEIAMLMCYEATRDLPLEEVDVKTPVAVAKCKRISGKKLAIVPILRAGLGMVDGMVSMMPNVKVGHIGLFRDPQTLEPVKYYFKMPADIEERDVIVVDPMLATGGSASAAITFLKQDDEADGEKALNAYNTMMDEGMQVLVGPTTTGASLTVSDQTNADRTFMLTPSASSPDVTKDKDNVFQVCFTDPNQGTGAADYIAENMTGAKVAVIYRNDDAYSQGIRDTFVKEAEAKGAFEIVSETTFTDATSTDFTVQLTAAKNAGADLVFLPIYYQPASVILSQAKAMSYEPTFFGVDGMDGILTMPGFDASLAEGVMLLTPFSVNSEDAATQSFVKTYTEKYGVEPNQFAADAYDGVYIVKAALEKAGCTADMSSTDICEALIQVMPTLSVDGLTGKAMTWNAEGEVSKAPLAAVIENGEYVMK